MAFLSTQDAVIHYEITGQGEPLVLLHGNGEDLHLFDHMIPLFRSRYQVIRMDSRAHGQSICTSHQLKLTDMAQDVAALLDHLHLERASLIGFSDGGNVALYFALYHPGMLRRLVIAGANIDPNGMKRSSLLPIQVQYHLLRPLPFSKAQKKRQLLGLMVNEPHITPKQLSVISAPTLVLAGDHDLIRETHTRLIAASIPHAQLRFITQCGHFIFERNETFQTILSFLQTDKS